ncbi:hypothetical protein M408DRAFT_6586 [Serendipita vermifera MAFF 305830]|uniref:Uncharacterized protein n=1 Tax=Serendipita vermifera MAFF 305830 TaxID=933852 RepID=A0A0C2XTV9_SERVB|nr:hypothetical protein M408DRAFT_6586 [Serendipita vermifera MAFF 305830]
MPFAPSPAEVAIVNQIFAKADPQKLGLVTGEQGIKVFAGSNLPPATLGDIWALADPENNGALTRKGVAITVRLIGWAQNGETPSSELLEKVGPLPAIEGLALPAVPTLPARTPAPIATQPFSLPPLLPTDRAKFLGLFNKTNPAGGLMSGDQARSMFIRSKLPVERLNAIWNLVDTQNRGSLESTQFVLAMYFIQGSMSANPTIPVLPASIPPFLWDQAGGRPPSVHSHTSGDSLPSPGYQSSFAAKPFTPQYTGGSMSALQQQATGDLNSRSQFMGGPLTPQMTGGRVPPAIPSRSSNFAITPQLTGTPFPLARQPAVPSVPWDVTAEEKVKSDGFFDTLDTARLGYVEGAAAVPFMLLSGLPEEVLARIWDLADMRNDGRLTKETFAVAMHLINGVLEGKELPPVLPNTLIPPSLRGAAGFAALPPAAPVISETHRDLLSLDDDLPVSPPQPKAVPQAAPVPVISQIAANALNPQAQTPPVLSPPTRSPFSKDLLEDEEAEERQTRKLNDNNVEIANLRNQLSSTTNAHEAAANERAKLEADLATSAATLSQLQTQLASAKVGYDTETRLLAGLRERYQTQATEIQSTRDELIRAESDLSALKLEKTEIQGNILREKDDVIALKRRVTEITEETASVKKEIEQAKKDARMQKGLLAIAKKQLSTAEADKEAAEKELHEAREEAQTAEDEVAHTEVAVAMLKERSMSNASSIPEGNGSAIAGYSASPKALASPASVAMATLPYDIPKVGSPAPSVKSNNPFDRLRQSSVSDGALPQRSASPFAMPSGPTEPTTVEQAEDDDPFGFNESTTPSQVPASTTEMAFTGTETPRQQSVGTNDVSEKAAPVEQNNLMSPSDAFFTPPTSSAGNNAIDAFFASEQDASASKFPALVDEPRQSPKADADIPPMTEIVENADDSSSDSDDDVPLGQVMSEKQTANAGQQANSAGNNAIDAFFASEQDASASKFPALVDEPRQSPKADADIPPMTEIVENADDSSDSDDDVPLGQVMSGKQTANAGQQAKSAPIDHSFDDAFGIPTISTDTPTATNTAPSSHFSTLGSEQVLSSPAVSTVPSSISPAVNGHNTGASTLNAFDEAMGLMPAATNAAPANEAFKFDNFDDTFDFGETSFTHAKSQSTESATPVPAPVPTATSPTFDDAFGLPAASPAAKVPAPKAPLSFDDAFEVSTNGEHAPQAQSLAFPIAEQAPVQTPVDVTHTQPHQNGVAPTGSSVRSASPTAVRGSSSSARATSPPPPTSSPKLSAARPRPAKEATPRPGSSLTPDAAGPSRSSRLSIHFPFGRSKTTKEKKEKEKKDKHAKEHGHDTAGGVMPPVPSIPEDYSGDRYEAPEIHTPDQDGDIPPLKQLMELGFSREKALTALENSNYNFQRALNKLLSAA